MKYFNWSNLKSDREFSHKLVTFFLVMAQGGPVSQTAIKRKLEDELKQIYEIHVKIESSINRVTTHTYLHLRQQRLNYRKKF